MKHEIKYSPAAVRDLDRVYSDVFDASKSRDVADKYLNDFLSRIHSKASFPKAGIPLYYENAFTGYYYVVFKAYLAFYRLEGNALLVDRVLYGKSDYLKLLIHMDETS